MNMMKVNLTGFFDTRWSILIAVLVDHFIEKKNNVQKFYEMLCKTCSKVNFCLLIRGTKQLQVLLTKESQYTMELVAKLKLKISQPYWFFWQMKVDLNGLPGKEKSNLMVLMLVMAKKSQPKFPGKWKSTLMIFPAKEPYWIFWQIKVNLTDSLGKLKAILLFFVAKESQTYKVNPVAFSGMAK